MSDEIETTGSTSFTAGETKLLISIMSNLQGDLSADWAAVATENNYKDASIAKTRWNQIRRKKIAPSPGKTAGVTKAPAKKGRAAGSPKAKGARGKGKKKADVPVSDDDEDGADAVDVKDKDAAETDVKAEDVDGGAGAEDGEITEHNDE
ncbi:hypothetical protein MBLNU457_1799t1 [Dothideomycetes sp. NU457]